MDPSGCPVHNIPYHHLVISTSQSLPVQDVSSMTLGQQEFQRREIAVFFSAKFKSTRIYMDYTLSDVAQQLSLRYDFPGCEGKLRRFESTDLHLGELYK